MLAVAATSLFCRPWKSPQISKPREGNATGHLLFRTCPSIVREAARGRAHPAHRGLYLHPKLGRNSLIAASCRTLPFLSTIRRSHAFGSPRLNPLVDNGPVRRLLPRRAIHRTIRVDREPR